jgi:hypothetical protein
MFTFINLSILTLLFAVALPVLIHLFNKQKKRKVQFSSIRFLKILEKQKLKKVRIYEILLIVIRSLILLFLIFAFARPTLTSQSLFKERNARSTAVVLLDDNINMRRYDQKGNRFNRAKSVLYRLLKQFNDQDQIFIIQTSNPQTVLKSPVELEKLSAKYSFGGWDFSFRQARQVIEENPNFNKEIYVISDFQYRDPGFSDFFSSFSDARIFLLNVGDQPVNNAGIDTMIISNQIFEPNLPVKLEIRLRRSPESELTDTEMHLFVDGQRVFHQNINFSGQDEQVTHVSFLPRHTGIITGYAEISDDDLLADNKYYFTLLIPEEINLLFVDDSPSPFINAALKSLSENTNIIFMMENYSTWARQSFQQYDLIWLANLPVIPRQISQRLVNFLESGRSVIIMPGSRTVPADYNNFLSALKSNIRIQDLHQTQTKDNFFSLKTPDLSHPLFRGLFRSDDPQITKPKFYRYFGMAGQTQAEFLLAFQNGRPYLLEENLNAGRLFLFAGYIDDSWTDLQYRGLFIPLLSRLIHFSQSRQTRQITSFTLGEKAVIKIYDAHQAGRFFLELPGGDKQTIIPEISGESYQFNLAQLSDPGLYSIQTADNKIVSSFAVNCQTSLLFPPFCNTGQIANSSAQIRTYSEDTFFESKISEARFGTELWKIFIILALILLGIEMLIIRLTEGRQKN